MPARLRWYVGSLTVAAGFVLVPYLGTQASLTLIVVLNLLLFLVVVASQPSLRRDGRLRRRTSRP